MKLLSGILKNVGSKNLSPKFKFGIGPHGKIKNQLSIPERKDKIGRFWGYFILDKGQFDPGRHKVIWGSFNALCVFNKMTP